MEVVSQNEVINANIEFFKKLNAEVSQTKHKNHPVDSGALSRALWGDR